MLDTYEPADTPCGSDASLCTADVCKAAGECEHSTAGIAYDLCLYDDLGAAFLLSHVTSGCDNFFCWAETSKGLKVRSSRDLQGKVKVALTAGMPGRISFKTRNTVEGIPALPLSTPVEIRLTRSDNGQCWSATYDAGVRKNTDVLFQGRSN